MAQVPGDREFERRAARAGGMLRGVGLPFNTIDSPARVVDDLVVDTLDGTAAQGEVHVVAYDWISPLGECAPGGLRAQRTPTLFTGPPRFTPTPPL